jgi:dienelactone hydrolase
MSGPVARSHADSRDASHDPEALERAFHDEAPARAGLRRLESAGTWHAAPAQRLELISRGDIVNGVLARAATGDARPGAAPSALLLVAHDLGGASTSPALAPVASWIGEGLAVAAIDLPLHGDRASPKLSERLIASIARHERGGALDRNSAVLVEEFWRQATIDLVRTLDAVLALDGFDPERVGFLGLGLGAGLGSALLAHDDRLCAAVLARPAETRSPAAPAAAIDRDGSRHRARADVLRLDAELDSGAWSAEARPFLASRLGF